MSLQACSFLQISPDASIDVQIDTEEKIGELLTGAYPRASYFSVMETMSDNVGERINGIPDRPNEALYFWETYDQDDLDTPLFYWIECYRGIAQANKALELLAGHEKSEWVKALYGEAFLLRAYLHFMLVNLWSNPFSESDAISPGIPYVTVPEKSTGATYSRGTVKEVYSQIEEDLLRGLSLVDDRYYTRPKYHFNKKAGYAFATRFYLMKGEWQKVVDFADFVLTSDPTSTLRVLKNGTTPTPHFDLSLPCNLLASATESRLTHTLPTQKYGPTLETQNQAFGKKFLEGLSAFKQWHYKYKLSPNFIQEGLYLDKFDELTMNGHIGSRPRNIFVTNILFTTDEVLLNRMEAYAMLCQYNKAIADMQDYMKGKFDLNLQVPIANYTLPDGGSSLAPFYGMSDRQKGFVSRVLALRRMEFFQEGLRWLDIRRFHLPVKRKSSSALYRELSGNDFRKVLQLPSEAIKSGLEPNPRDEDNWSRPLPEY